MIKEQLEAKIKELEDESSLLIWWYVGRYYEEVQSYLDKLNVVYPPVDVDTLWNGGQIVGRRIDEITPLIKNYKWVLESVNMEREQEYVKLMLDQEVDFWNVVK